MASAGRRPQTNPARGSRRRVQAPGRRASATPAARVGGPRRPALHEPKVGPDIPAQSPPEFPGRPVAGEKKQVALGDARLAELPEADGDQCPSHALAPPFPVDGKVMQVAPPAVVAAQHGRDHAALGDGSLAEAGVPSQESSDWLPVVGLAEADALGLPPDRIDLLIICDAERTKADRWSRGHESR